MVEMALTPIKHQVPNFLDQLTGPETYVVLEAAKQQRRLIPRLGVHGLEAVRVLRIYVDRGDEGARQVVERHFEEDLGVRDGGRRRSGSRIRPCGQFMSVR